MNKKISIIGCGWLGTPTALNLQELGYHVKGSTTKANKVASLQALGIAPYIVRLHEDKIEGDITAFLEDSAIALINVPPKLRGPNKENYVAKMQLLYQELINAQCKWVLFVSSTSVYGNAEGIITEDTPTQPITESGKQLVQAEALFKKGPWKTTVIRFGGLIGPNRHPVNHLSGKSNLTNGDELVNLIHLDDCIHMITTILLHEYAEITFNGVYPNHPTKREYYTQEAVRKGLKPPGFSQKIKNFPQKKILCRNFLNKNHFLQTTLKST
ncbi:SDR family NAD(P)-dependent oxidoreductase [Flavobacterium sp. ASW18X]|uniref:SDR family NAD(P)-dependent oxidoreductase n=1 Tax=Flavobacterium sp. ASW18X TaxID=2572595 RepID=UPI0010AE65F5|nr:SDR family NAD(P)-dependent oxidoreductase [Flavobacterium sp. ASW18X]TKD67013.1 SDR family NAD(P)-dependent oxidoreductase [Flavobacterium sp. ASW18X]